MNVLLVADLHYTLQQYDWLQQVAAEFDAVVIAGDLLEVASPVPRKGQMIAVLKQQTRLDRRQIMCFRRPNVFEVRSLEVFAIP